MSFKLFLLQTLGKLKPAEKIEADRRALWKDYQEFNEVESSDELKEYLELGKWVGSEEFKNRKREVEALVYKGSTEFKQLKEFRKLAGSKPIKRYFEAEKSGELKRFEAFKESEKLAEYYELKDYVENGEYQKEKDEIKRQVFKGSVEEKHLKEFIKIKNSKPVKAYFELEGSSDLKGHETFASSDKLKRFLALKHTPEKNGKKEKKELASLKKDAEIRKYFRFEKSKKLKYYHEINGSHTLNRYNELLKLTDSDDFKKRKAWLEDKTKYEKSEAHKKFSRFKQFAADGDIKFFLSYEKSKIYKNYLDVKDSFDLKRYYELKELTESKEFLEKKAYLEDKKKWEKTPEYEKQQKFLEMKKLPHLVNYFKYKGGHAFDFFKTWDVVFEDEFNSAKPDESKWSVLGYWAKKLVGENYSQPGDLQYFSEGNNIITGKKGLAVQVRRENATGKFWNPAAGFTPAEFQYTSGQLNTGDNFRLEDGIVEAKARFNPVGEIASIFYLLGEKASPQLNIVEMGVKNRMGILTSKDGKVVFSGINISNLKKGQYHLFAIKKEGGKIEWKINDKVVFERQSSEFNFPMYLNLASIVVKEVPGSKLPANFEVAWIKCFRKKV